MTRVLLLGVGKQGKAALYDLEHSDGVTEIVAADREIEALQAYVQANRYSKVHCACVDADDGSALDRLMACGPDVILDLLPITAIANVAATAVTRGIHLVNLPTLVWLFDKSQPRGWVDAHVGTDAISLELHSLDPSHPKHGEKVELKWRV